ncbi:hypothetical protein HK102_008111 [Quaeritorhiza haematococci]|nr:hypothetical protein HK102_008111 [Quaeritorhiza haematococci]
MKLFENSYRFTYPWHTLTAANWRKYPNEYTQHVVAVDVLNRELDPQTGILRTERLLVCKQNPPTLFKKLGVPVPELAYFREISEIDPRAKTYAAETINLTFRNIFQVEETVLFKEDPEQPKDATMFSQVAKVSTFGPFSAVGRFLEEAMISRCRANASKGRAGLELVIEKVLAEARDIETHIVTGLEELRREFTGQATAAAASSINSS